MEEFINFVVANKAILSALGVALISELMALVPGCKSNGLLHLALNLLQSVKGGKDA